VNTEVSAIRDYKRSPDMEKAANAGLVLDSYLEQHGDKGEARRFLLADASCAAVNAQPLYEAAFNRYVRGIAETPNTVQVEFRTIGRLITGLGIESVLETGLRLHGTYGTPLIPGSSLKGLAAHYCSGIWGLQSGNEQFREFVEGLDDEGNKVERPGEYYHFLFGDTDDAGHLTFHDAWITPVCLTPPKNGERRIRGLVEDVMTPHHPAYAEGAAPPSDMDSPVPINFLSVAGSFLVSASCDVSGDNGLRWAEAAMRLLEQAMRDWGAGGKTSSGYGRMERQVEAPRQVR